MSNDTVQTYTLSSQQSAVIDFALKSKGHLNLVARAGCGKTSTLMALVKALADHNPKVNIFVGAYNKSIAAEISGKLAAMGIGWKQAEAATMHSIGYRAWRKIAPGVIIDEHKTDLLFEDYLTAHPDLKEDLEQFAPFIRKLVSLAKQRAFGVLSVIDDTGKWFDLVDHFGLEEELPEDSPFDVAALVEIAVEIFKKSRANDKHVIDYDDMILAPLTHKARFWQYDWVLIDEAQDTNPARRALALALLKPTYGRLVAVGDPAQAIYGFTGADSNSMNLIKAELNSKVLPLTVTYRCAKSVVTLAQQWVPDIEANSTNQEGNVNSMDYETFLKQTFSPSDAILCRKNAPLVSLAFQFIRKGIPCQVEGRDIGRGLLSITNKWKLRTIAAFLNKLEEYRDKELQRYQAKGKETHAANLEDKVETLRVLAAKLQSEQRHDIDDLRKLISVMFGDSKPEEYNKRLTLCSVHKSKGREWDKVYLLGRNRYMPSKWARKDWQLEQEDNLCYVAVTRAKNTLIDVNVVEKDQLG